MYFAKKKCKQERETITFMKETGKQGKKRQTNIGKLIIKLSALGLMTINAVVWLQ